MELQDLVSDAQKTGKMAKNRDFRGLFGLWRAVI